jgi:hypothetical protein
VWYDDISLVVNSTQRLQGGDFEVFVPNRWHALNLNGSTDGPDCDIAHGGDCSAVLLGNGDTKQFRYVSITNGHAGDTLEFSFWVRSVNAANPFFAKLVLYNTADASTQDVRIVPSQGSQGWTHYTSGAFTATGDYDRIRVYLLYGNNSGQVWYDDVSLMR